MSELKRCPFCGGEAYLETIPNLASNEYVVCCKNKECLGFYIGYGDVGLYGTKDGAIKAWNTRKPVEKTLERLEETSYWTQSTFDEDGYCNDDSERVIDLDKVIEIIKEEVE